MRILRVLRGIVKTAVTWAVVWVPLSLIPFAIGAVFSSVPFTRQIWSAMVIGQLLAGAINGGIFATVLALRGRRKTFESLSLPWIASCGAIGAVVLPLAVRGVLASVLGVQMPLTALALTLATNAALGAGLAAASLSVARRAPVLHDGDDSDLPAIGSADTGREPEKELRALRDSHPLLTAAPLHA